VYEYRLPVHTCINEFDDNVCCCSCTCAGGFEGDRCETNIDDCPGHQCQNNATCLDGVDRYSCNCPPGFTGKLIIRSPLTVVEGRCAIKSVRLLYPPVNGVKLADILFSLLSVFLSVCLSVCLCVCVCAYSVQSSTVCVPPTTHQPSPSCNPSPSPNPCPLGGYMHSERLLVYFWFNRSEKNIVMYSKKAQNRCDTAVYQM